MDAVPAAAAGVDDRVRRANDLRQRNEARRREVTARSRRLDRAKGDVLTAESRWRQRAAEYAREYPELAAAVSREVARCRRLAEECRDEAQRLTAAAASCSNATATPFERPAAAAELARHLRLHQLADADIPGIGPTRKQALAAAGITTAADVTEERVRGVKGFGDVFTANVLAWVEGLARGYVHDPVTTAPSAAGRRDLDDRYRQRQEAILADLRGRVAAAERSFQACRAEIAAVERDLRRAVAECAQAEADVQAMGR